MINSEFEKFELTTALLRTGNARKVYDIMNKGTMRAIIEKIRAYFLVMGPGRGKEGFEVRMKIRRLIEKKKGQVAIFPEEITAENFKAFMESIGINTSHLKNLVVNPATKEYVLVLMCDITIILLVSVDAISEFSICFTKQDIAHKIRVFYPERFSKDPSFVRLGPLELFRRVYHQVYTFKDYEELEEKANEMIDDYLVYLLLSKF
jgi:hypothetical protein